MARAISSRRSRGTFSGTSERSETGTGVGRSACGAAARGGLGGGRGAVHVAPQGRGGPVADPARPHAKRPGVKGCPPPVRLTAAGVFLLAAANPAGDDVIALAGATLIDGSGREPVKDALILVRGGHIEAVARVNEIPVPRGAREISLIGKTVIPGLIDAHAHVERWAVERYVAWGVTTVRDLGAMTTDSALDRKSVV